MIRRGMFSMCQCGTCAARHDGGVTRLKNAASCESTIRSAYPWPQQRQHRRDARFVGQHVLHAEAVHADRGAGVHQLTQVVEVLAVAAVADDQPLGRDARARVKKASWSRPFCDGAWVCVVIGTPVCWWAWPRQPSSPAVRRE